MVNSFYLQCELRKPATDTIPYHYWVTWLPMNKAKVGVEHKEFTVWTVYSLIKMTREQLGGLK